MLCGCFASKKPAEVYQETSRNRPPQLTRDYMVKNNDLRGWQDTGDDIMRRTAFRMLQNSPEHRQLSARQGLTDRDPVIRRSAVYSLYEIAGEKALPEITRLGQDPDFNVRYMVAVCAAALAKKNSAEALLYLENTARIDSDVRIRQFASRALWPYHRETKLLRDILPEGRPVEKIKTIALPLKNWKFQLDPSLTGHLEKWQSATLDDSGWNQIDMGYWEEQGFDEYNGIAWYRIRFNMPEILNCSAVQLNFDGVEDSAWVWLNNEYLGQQNLGKAGAGTPFQLDATREIRWGQENILVVRISNSYGNGGIFKPLTVELYQ
jgi:hypothetical protein